MGDETQMGHAHAQTAVSALYKDVRDETINDITDSRGTTSDLSVKQDSMVRCICQLAKYLILLVIIVTTIVTAGENDVIYDIGVTFCPCTRFCHRNNNDTIDGNVTDDVQPGAGDEIAGVCSSVGYYQPQDLDPLNEEISVMCCSDCSCDDHCWKTANCCPDKHDIREEPSITCRSPVVKPFPNESPSILGYFVIDSCPGDEDNDLLISKCIADEKSEVNDYIWVSDVTDGLTYQNEYCAQCNHVTEYTKWQLLTECSAFNNLQTLLLSDSCKLELERPPNVSSPVCVIPDYSYCNQTGKWQRYNAEIDRACSIYHSVYFVEGITYPSLTGEITEIDIYKNVFCHYCNNDDIVPADVKCRLGAGFGQGLEPSFTTLIEYRGYHHMVDEEVDQHPISACKRNEVMDKYMGSCRSLRCPFPLQPVIGECRSLFDDIKNLPVEIMLELNVLWNHTNYSLSDDGRSLYALGSIITHTFTGSLDFLNHATCPPCIEKLTLVSGVVENAFSAGNKSLSDIEHGSKSGPDFMYRVIIFTTEKCNLDFISDQVRKASGHFPIDMDGDGAKLYVFSSLFDGSEGQVIEKKTLLYEAFDHCNPTSYYTIREQKRCPVIGLKYSEFSQFQGNANRAVIDSLFTGNQSVTDDVVDICLEDYYEKMALITFATDSNFSVEKQANTMCTIIVLYIFVIIKFDFLELHDY